MQGEVEAALASDATPFESEFRVYNPEKGARVFRSVARVTRDDQGRAVRMTGVNLDVTEDRRAAEALRNAAKRNAAVLDNVAETVAVKQLSPTANLAALTLELPDPQRQQAFGLLCLVNDALTSGRYSHDQRTQYLLQQTLDTYLPDTLRAYLDLTPGAAQKVENSGQPARQLLSEQLTLMTGGIREALRHDHAAATVSP